MEIWLAFVAAGRRRGAPRRLSGGTLLTSAGV